MKRGFLAFVLSFVFAAHPAFAKTPAYVSKHKVLDDLAACIVNQYGKVAQEFMKTEPGSKDEFKSMRSLVERSNGCIGRRAVLSMHAGQIRGSLAHVLLLGDGTRVKRIEDMQAATPSRIEKSEGRVFVASFANCVAVANPKAALALIRTERSSPAEKEAVLSLGDAMKACMPVGVAYPINIPDMRNHMADALYRMSEPENA